MSPPVKTSVKDRKRALVEVFLPQTVGIIVYDSDGRCGSVNEAAVQIIGHSQEVLLGQDLRHSGFWRDSGLLPQAEAALAGVAHRAVISFAAGHGTVRRLEVCLEPVGVAKQRAL